MTRGPRAQSAAAGLATRIILLLAGAWGVQSVIATIERAHGRRDDVLLPGSIFGDTIDSALAIRVISAPLLTDPRVLRWQELFRHFLYQNDYLGGHITIYHVLPLALLHLMAMAKIMVLSSPWTALEVSLLVYIVGAICVQKFVDGLHTSEPDGHLVWALFLFSYPALFMLERANYAAGYANLGAVFYLITAVKGRGRWIGFVALACVLNIRPNAGLIALVEFARVGRVWPALRAGVAIGVIAALIGLGAGTLAHSIDPGVSMGAFIRGYGLYQAFYVFGDWGMYWNDSLFGVARIIASMSGRHPAYDPAVADLIGALCGVGLLGLGWLVWSGRTTRVEAAFLSASACVLITPVYCEYHGLIMIAPLLLVCEGLRARGTAFPLERAWPLLAALILGCVTLSLFPSGPGAAAMFATAALAPVIAARAARAAPGASPIDRVILVASFLSLCPLGGQWTNGLVTAGLLLSASLLVGRTCWLRPPGLTLGDRLGLGPGSAAPGAAVTTAS